MLAKIPQEYHYQNYIPFSDFMPYCELNSLWNKWLINYGYPMDLNVCELPTDQLHYIYNEIADYIERHGYARQNAR